ncbi:MAG: hypothetical protein ACPLN0_05880 [Candidatus Hydrothermia bacterium]
MLSFLFLLGLSIDSLKSFSYKNFACDFQEIVVYKDIASQDTFIGTLTKKNNTVTFEIKKPSREVYKIIKDTLFVETNGKVSKEPLSDQAMKFLNFSFFEDTISYNIVINDSILFLYPKDSENFNYLKLITKDYFPQRLELDDDQKKLIFKFSRWRFLKDK